jgi:AcrR family transcriptional regulator
MSGRQLQAVAKEGRPRKAATDHVVLTAVRELLAEQGYKATTVQAISSRAGVPISSIYRRWPTRVKLIEDAAAISSPRLGGPTGDLPGDLLRFARELRMAFTAPATRAAVPFLLGEYLVGHLGRPPEEWVRHSWRPLLSEILGSGRGVTDSGIDADMLFDLLLGSVLVQLYVPTAMRRRASDDPTEVLCRLVAPRRGGGAFEQVPNAMKCPE